MTHVVKLLLVATGAFVLGIPASRLQPATAAEIASAFYPPWLQELRTRTELNMDRQQCVTVYDALPNGQPFTIVAAYTNGIVGAIRVLRSTGGSFAVVDEPRDIDLLGTRCEIAVLDVDGDGRREVHLTLSADLQTTHWLFRWDGRRLTNVGPITPAPATGRPRSVWMNGSFIDVDLDGRLEFYGGGPSKTREGESPRPGRIWRISGDTFAPGDPLVALLELIREKGEPETTRMTLRLPAGAWGPFTLEIRNGNAAGGSRVASGQVWLNQQEIVSPSDFRRATGLVEREVSLNLENELAVRLAGEPGGRILIMIRSANWQ